MRRLAVVSGALVVVLPCVVVETAVADGVAVTVGQNGATNTCGSPTLYLQDAVAAGAAYTTPAGVVTSWTVLVPSTTGATVKLKTVHEGPSNTYTIQRSSDAAVLASTGANTFPSRIPVVAGDSVALWAATTGNTPCGFITNLPGDQFGVLILGSEPQPGNSFAFPSFNTGFRLNLSATVEPDADGDGYGDLTQDTCPSRATSQGDCQPPETGFGKVKKRIATRGKRARVALPLTATEPAAFTCSVDGRKPKPCTSPLRARLTPGTHVFYVTSTDAAGNTDITAATLRIKVTRKAR
jgi:hypothetical protein